MKWIAVSVFVLSACGSDAIDPPTTDATIVVADATVDVRSTGCGTAQASGLRTETLTIRGEERNYLISVPDGYDPEFPAALHIALHGCGSDSMSHWYSMKERADLETAFGAEAVHVYPQGLPNSGCPTGWEMTSDGKDVEFLDEIQRVMAEQFCIDTRGIVLTGMSYGGDFTNKYACARPEAIAVAAAQASSPWPHNDCVGPVPMVATYALGDQFAEQYTGPGFVDSREFWRGKNECDDVTVPEQPSPCVRYQGCAEPLVACEVPGGDHGTFPDDFGNVMKRLYLELR